MLVVSLRRRAGAVRPRAGGRAAPRRATPSSSARCGSATRSTSRAAIADVAPARRRHRPRRRRPRRRQPGDRARLRARRSRCSGAAATRPRRRPRSARRRTARWCRCDARRQADPRSPASMTARLDRLRGRRAGPGARRRGRADRLRPRAAHDRARRAPPARARPTCSSSTSTPRTTSPPARRAGASAGAASTASLHAIAFAPADALGGDFLDTPRRERRDGVPDERRTRCKALAEALLPLLSAPRRRQRRRPGLRRHRWPGRSTTGWASPRRRSRRSRATWPATSARSGVRVNLVSAGPIADARRRRHPRLRRARRHVGAAGAPLGWDIARPGARSPRPSCFLLSDAVARRSPARSSTSTAASTPSARRLSAGARSRPGRYAGSSAR